MEADAKTKGEPVDTVTLIEDSLGCLLSTGMSIDQILDMPMPLLGKCAGLVTRHQQKQVAALFGAGPSAKPATPEAKEKAFLAQLQESGDLEG